jgi:glycosyltransferase involved in cell wall biosynthesis
MNLYTKRILIFTDYFLPGNRAGGPVTSINNLSSLLGGNFEIFVATRHKDIGSTVPYSGVEYSKPVSFENFKVIYLPDVSFLSITKIITTINADIIYLNSIFSRFSQFVFLLAILSNYMSKIVLAPRGELQKNALMIKPIRKYLYISIFKLLRLHKKVIFHATDQIEQDSILQYFANANIHVLPNIPRLYCAEPLTKKENELRIVFISRIRDNKNLLYALDILCACTVEIVFDIYGPIEDQAYWGMCKQAIGRLPPNITVEYKGIIVSSAIFEEMRKYHAILLPTKTENFGHVIVEAMLSGVIPIISNQTPWIGLKEYNAGWDIDLGEPKFFMDAINALYTMPNTQFQLLSASTMDFINKKLNTDDIAQMYNRFFGKECC